MLKKEQNISEIDITISLIGNKTIAKENQTSRYGTFLF